MSSFWRKLERKSEDSASSFVPLSARKMLKAHQDAQETAALYPASKAGGNGHAQPGEETVSRQIDKSSILTRLRKQSQALS